MAGLVQGILTATITRFLKLSAETIFHRPIGVFRLLLLPLVASFVSFVFLTTVHTFAGTPALILTILVPLTVSTLYASC
ncbi:MAG: hypothetical protein AAGA38_05895 [Pseudomonadota bacterium]